MTSPVRLIKGAPFRQVATVNAGENFYLAAGRQIAVETWAIDWGKHVFDYELNSRPVSANGRPQAIATTRSALEREFMERRVVSRYPIPVSVGMNGMRRAPDVALTLGEVSPQVYTSRVEGPRVAWSLAFRSHRHNGAVGGKRASQGRATANATMPGSGRAGGMSTSFNYLAVYVPAADWGAARELPGGFGVTDLIGTEPGLIQRWIARITGE